MEYHRNYFTRKRAKFKALSGEVVNLPYGTLVEGDGGVLFYSGKPLTYRTSQNAIDYFVQNDDGFGEKRAELVNNITKTLETRDKKYQDRWNRVWGDNICQPYKRKEFDDHWLWNRSFYDAPIIILEHIAGLVTKEA